VDVVTIDVAMALGAYARYKSNGVTAQNGDAADYHTSRNSHQCRFVESISKAGLRQLPDREESMNRQFT
jgi:hypothetical protein